MQTVFVCFSLNNHHLILHTQRHYLMHVNVSYSISFRFTWFKMRAILHEVPRETVERNFCFLEKRWYL